MRTKKSTKGRYAKINEVFGAESLCTWLVHEKDGVQTVRIQTRNPAFVRPISKLGVNRTTPKKARLVAYAVTGAYLRVYEIDMPIIEVVAFIDGILVRTEAEAA